MSQLTSETSLLSGAPKLKPKPLTTEQSTAALKFRKLSISEKLKWFAKQNGMIKWDETNQCVVCLIGEIICPFQLFEEAKSLDDYLIPMIEAMYIESLIGGTPDADILDIPKFSQILDLP